MTNKVDRYFNKLSLSLSYRLNGSDSDDTLLEELDELWLSMDPEEHEYINARWKDEIDSRSLSE